MFRSEAQRRFFHEAAHNGTHGITQAMADEFEAATPKDANLPTYVRAKTRLLHKLLPPKK